MAEEFQAGAGICGGNWWNIDSTRSVFPAAAPPIPITSSDFMDLKSSRSCGDEGTNNFVSDHSNYQLCFPDPQKQHKSVESSDGIFIDSTLQIMGFGLSSNSTSSNWDHSLFRCNERGGESNFEPMIQEERGMDCSNSQIQEFPSDQERLNCISSSGSSTSNGLTSSIGSSSYGFPSSLYEPQPQQHSLFTNRTLSYSSTGNYGAVPSSSSTNQVSPIWSNKVISSFLKPSSSSSMAKQQQQQQPPHNIGLHFSNNTPFWNASADSLHDMRAGAFASSQSQYKTPTTFDQDKPNCPTILFNKIKSEESLDSASVAKKSVCEPSFKRPRIETPSPLPTFKVRKEKLGDRVTALQQLVSPFGKTDTASVLHEAIEYIKFLHDQVSALSTPYMKSGAPIQRQQGCDEVKESEGAKQDLRSRGLCLVPISSTFPVATETAADLWTPTLSFGGALLRSGR